MDMLLELDHISKIYGDLHAVDDLSLTVPQGEWLAIVGSVGQPRDRDARAMYALFDEQACSITFHRVPYDHAAAAVSAHRRGECHVVLIGQRHVFFVNDRTDLADRNGFAGQSRLIDLQIVGSDDAAVAGNVIPGFQLNDVADDQFPGRNGLQHAAEKADEAANERADHGERHGFPHAAEVDHAVVLPKLDDVTDEL